MATMLIYTMACALNTPMLLRRANTPMLLRHSVPPTPLTMRFGDYDDDDRYGYGYAGGGRGGGYDRSYRAVGDTSGIDVAQVEALVQERVNARAQRNFDAADAIRDQLRDLGVHIDDRDQTWSRRREGGGGYGGGYGSSYGGGYGGGYGGRDRGSGRNDRGGRSNFRGYYEDDQGYGVRRGGGRAGGFSSRGGGYGVYERDPTDTAEVDVQRVTSLLEERSECRRQRDYASADAIRDELSAMGVVVKDADMIWFVGRDGGRGRDKDFGPAGHDYEYVRAEPAEGTAKGKTWTAKGAEGAAREGTEEAASDDVDLEERGAELKALTVPELKEICRGYGLLVGGKKADLLDRIVEHEASLTNAEGGNAEGAKGGEAGGEEGEEGEGGEQATALDFADPEGDLLDEINALMARRLRANLTCHPNPDPYLTHDPAPNPGAAAPSQART